jgi:oligosaccharide repeat unit polymerase
MGGCQLMPPAGGKNTAAWWLSPTAVTVVVAAVSFSLTAAIGDDVFRQLWNSPKAVTGAALLLIVCGPLALALSSSGVGAFRPVVQPTEGWPGLNPRAVSLLSRASTILVALSAFGFLVFAARIAQSGITLSDLGAGGPAIKDLVGTVPGLTTMTQFGIPAVIISSLLLVQQYSRAELAKIAAVVAMAIPRAFVWQERLAILELVVPIIVVVCYRLAAAGKATRSIRLLPLVAIPSALGVFAVFEYFRSWHYFRESSDSFLGFATDRFAGYYATAINNGYLELTHLNWPERMPRATVDFFWNAPGVQELGLHDRLAGNLPGRTTPATPDDYRVMLTQFGNPEFNNSSGYTAPFLDYGTVGGLLYFLVVGVIAGLLYRGFREGRPFGLFLYPLLFGCLVELPRYVGWAAGRSAPAWAALIVVAIALTRLRNVEATLTPPRAAATEQLAQQSVAR